MAVSYDKMWKLLIDKKMSPNELRLAINVAPNTMTKIRKEMTVSMNILCRICDVLDCDIGDIVEYRRENRTIKGEKRNGKKESGN